VRHRISVRRVVLLSGALGFSVLWVTVEHPLEGPTIVHLTDTRGVHLADPLGFAPLGLVLHASIRAGQRGDPR